MNDYEIKKLYEEMELHLINSMRRNFGRHLTEEKEVGFKFTQWQAEKLKELKRYQRENKKIIGRYTLGLDEDVSEHLQNELKQGSIEAIKQYNKALGKDLKPSKVMNKSFFQTNDRKVDALIKMVNDDLKTANTSALRMANDQYRQIIHKSAFFVGNGVFTEKQAAAQAVKEISEKKLTTLAVDEASKNFLAGGLNCIEYSDGRRVNIASYAQMAVRTASLRSHLMGEGNFRASIGRTLVKVTTHGGACKLCTKWQGKVLVDDVYSGGKPDGKHTLLSEAMAQNFLHPNCRHGITTYYPELEEDDDEVIGPVSKEQEETQQQLNYAVRTAKKYRRLKTGSLAPLNIQRFASKEKEWINESKILNTQLHTYDDYIDVTNDWLEQATPNSHKVVDADYFFDGKTRYMVDGKNVVLDYNKKEKDVAEWLEQTLGGEIKMLPRVNNPKEVQTADYLFRKEKFDLKEVTGVGKRAVDSAIKRKKTQSPNFIIDITDNKLSEKELIEQVKKIYKTSGREWVDKIIVKKDDKLIAIYKRHKKRD